MTQTDVNTQTAAEAATTTELIDGVAYLVRDHVYYRGEMSTALVDAISSLMRRSCTVYVSRGNSDTGQDWFDVLHGRIGYTHRDLGGSTLVRVPVVWTRHTCRRLLISNIVRIRMVGFEGDLYRHPLYHFSPLTWCDGIEPTNPASVGILAANKLRWTFKNARAAKTWLTRHGVYYTRQCIWTHSVSRPRVERLQHLTGVRRPPRAFDLEE